MKLATAQEVAVHFKNLGVAEPVLTSEDILGARSDGMDLTELRGGPLEQQFVTETPLWFYILREAEKNGGKLGSIGGRIVAETFHRAMEGSHNSILKTPSWKPSGGKHPGGFGMVDILLAAYDRGKGELRPLSPPGP